jgi:hypothetical protein
VILRGHEEQVYAVAISPDDHWLVTGSADKTARIWDLSAKDPAANPVVLRGHEDQVRAVAISEDNHWVVTASADKTARLWLLQMNDLIKLARITIGRNFSADESKLYFPGEKYHKTFDELPGPSNPGNQKISTLTAMNAPAKAEATSFDTRFYFRLTNDFLGPGQSLDVHNPGSSRPRMSTTADAPGQLWKLVDLGAGKYALHTALLGDGFSLDVIDDGNDATPFLNTTGNYSGQVWELRRQDDATYKLTNDFTGPQKSLDTSPDTYEPFLNFGDYSGQHWTLTPVREVPPK